MATTKPLNPREARFVQEYMRDLNGTRAAVRAGYSERSATAQAARMLTRPRVHAAIEAAKESRARRAEVRADRTLIELKLSAFANLLDYAEWGPDGVRVKESKALTRAKAAGLVEVKQTKDGVSVKLAGKLQALELLGRHIGLWDGKGSRGGEIDSAEYVVSVRRVDGSGEAEDETADELEAGATE